MLLRHSPLGRSAPGHASRLHPRGKRTARSLASQILLVHLQPCSKIFGSRERPKDRSRMTRTARSPSSSRRERRDCPRVPSFATGSWTPYPKPTAESDGDQVEEASGPRRWLTSEL